MIKWKHILMAAVVVALLAGCSTASEESEVSELTSEEAASEVLEETEPTSEQIASVADSYVDIVPLDDVDLGNEAVPLTADPALPDLLLPTASGTKTAKNSKAVVDYSNTADGYVMVKFTGSTNKRLKVKVAGPTGSSYLYNINQGVWVTFPLSDGSGTYKVTVYEKKTTSTTDTKYATVLSTSFAVKLKDEFAPFLRPNQYVDYSVAPNTVAKAAELTKGVTDPLDKVEKIYSFVVKNLTYDKAKAASVQSGYLPVLDTVLEKKTGICFDYAALMTAMLRSQSVPCKLVVGYAGTAYHAWISVWTEDAGWINAAVYFDGTSWQRMDPTFASSGKQSTAIMKYIGNGKNYTEKYFY